MAVCNETGERAENFLALHSRVHLLASSLLKYLWPPSVKISPDIYTQVFVTEENQTLSKKELHIEFPTRKNLGKNIVLFRGNFYVLSFFNRHWRGVNVCMNVRQKNRFTLRVHKSCLVCNVYRSF
jgi:hypothetical protein